MSNQPIDLNILPERYRPRRLSLPALLLVVLGIVVLLGLIPAAGSMSAARQKTADMETELDLAKTQLDQTQAEQVNTQEQADDIRRQIMETENAITRLQAELESLGQRRRPETAVRVRAVVETLIPRVHLSSVVQNGENFKITGEAGSQALVLDYARSFQTTRQFSNIRIVEITNTDPTGVAPEVKFIISLEQ